MKDLLFYLVKNIALEPDKVEVSQNEADGQVDFYITCASNDIGRLIGKKGKIIKSMRRLLGILAMREGKRVNIIMQDEAKPSVS
ncbi:KH domain-containing protein [Candidatus Microgenomates bacterium]|nr:KH domain-containing protein [Candidatus Microgenomates bacterium]